MVLKISLPSMLNTFTCVKTSVDKLADKSADRRHKTHKPLSKKQKGLFVLLSKTEARWHCHYEEGERKELNISLGCMSLTK